MTLIPKDLTPVYKATIAKGTNALRRQRATYVDLLPPCNNACPAGLNIQAFSLGVGAERSWTRRSGASRISRWGARWPTRSRRQHDRLG